VAAEDFMALIKAGRIGDARKMLKDEMQRAEFAPDTITQKKDGALTFTRQGKEVERNAQGIWHLKK
jgi:pentatricopeptide repeat protein